MPFFSHNVSFRSGVPIVIAPIMVQLVGYLPSIRYFYG